MSVARDHNEWLSLVPTSGPFLSLETLVRVFPQGLPARDAETARLLRLAWEEWEAEGKNRQPDVAIHTAWIRFVLTTVLGLPAESLVDGQQIPESIKAEKPEYGVTLRPTLVLMAPVSRRDELSLDLEDEEPETVETSAAFTPLLLIQTIERGQGLDKPERNRDVWSASPETRMQELLSQTQIPLGLITNGEHWQLVQRATDTTGFATFSAPIWLDEPVTLRAFCALFAPERFWGNPDETLLKMLTDSASDHQEVTDQLGYQVRRAVEMLVQAIDEVDRNRGGSLLVNVAPHTLYEGALTLMMRLVFLLCAEERGMFPLDEEVYGRNYAVSTLMGMLREAADAHGEEILERRCGAWSRLSATFRAIWGGVQHEAMRMPAYGGGLLDPNRFPWMDGAGENAIPLPIHNRTALHLLEALQILRVKLPGGGPAETRRLSFRALDIEQIGHVYEGLLDHTAVRASEPILGLIGTKEREPEISLSILEAKAAKGRKELLAYLKEETGRTDKTLQAALETPVVDEGKLLAACEGDTELLARVRPFAAMIRRDDFDRIMLIPAGRVYVTSGTARRSTGTHYTPRSLTEPIVRRTLEPLIYRGMPQGEKPTLKTLKTAQEILALKVCDMACGSGAFLVETCRYLADRLCEAWDIAEKANPDALLTTPEAKEATGDPAERLVPSKEESPEERRILARRLIAAHCLYGVDKNPAAVDIAKLSLWLVTMDRDKPFHFLDHAIKVGDSLLGCDLSQIRTWNLSGAPRGGQLSILSLLSNKALEDAIAMRRQLEHLSSDRIEFIERKARLHNAIEEKMKRARLAADLVIAPALMNEKPKAQETKRAEFQTRFVALPNNTNDAILQAEADALLNGAKPFHWGLEFPEVFDEGGFDAIVGNPPFMGGQKITGELGVPYREYLVQHLGRGKKGSADIVAYFFLRALQLLKERDGTFGLIATNTIAQGDTREVGLDQIVGDGHILYHALPSMKWPGKANLEVAVAHTYKGVWGGVRKLSERDVAEISAFLDDGTASGKPFRLKENAGKSFQGSIVLGMGFVLEPEQAAALVGKNPKNADVLRPYLNGEDLNSRPDQSPSRWVINFRDWPLGRIGQSLPVSGETLLHVAETMEINLSDEWRPKAGSRWEQAEQEWREKWLRIGVVPCDYPDPVAADYSDCLTIVEELVRPERNSYKPVNSWNKTVSRLWWLYGAWRKNLDATIAELPRVLAVPLVSKYISFVFAPVEWTFAHRLAVCAMSSGWQVAILQSEFHELWARQYSSTLESRINYSPSDCFETFPFPFGEGAEQNFAVPETNIAGKKLSGDGSDASVAGKNSFEEGNKLSGDGDETLREHLERIGEAYHAHRQSVCLSRQIGLTKVYNLFHDAVCHDADIVELRRLHAAMDTAVAAAYGWQDLELRHAFYGEGKETRCTIHPDAKGEILRRLLALNHERHAEQEAADEEIMPTLAEELETRTARRKSKTKSSIADNTQLTTDQILLAGILSDIEQKRNSVPIVQDDSIERAALMATYLIMRAEAPERLSGLRRYPARTRLTMPRSYKRTRLAKHLYFSQEIVKTKRGERLPVTNIAFSEYQRGPYTKEIEIMESEAVRRGWLKVAEVFDEGRKSVQYELGAKADEAVKRALELLGENEPLLDYELIPLDEPKTTLSEQWTTVHLAWKTLKDEKSENQLLKRLTLTFMRGNRNAPLLLTTPFSMCIAN